MFIQSVLVSTRRPEYARINMSSLYSASLSTNSTLLAKYSTLNGQNVKTLHNKSGLRDEQVRNLSISNKNQVNFSDTLLNGRKFDIIQQPTRGVANSTMNQAEVDKFARMAGDWWNPEGVCKPLHSMNKVRVPFVRDRLVPNHNGMAQPLKGLNILDVGCGGGILSEPLARLGASVTGVDACKENIDIAKFHSAKDKTTKHINYVCSTVEAFAESSEAKFDAIVASEIIEHVDNPQLFITSISSLLKDGGNLFITTLNRTTRSWLVAIVGAEYIVGMLPKGTHDWNKFLAPEEIEEMCEKAELGTRMVNGMTYIPVLNKWIWIPDKSVNFALHATKYEKQD